MKLLFTLTILVVVWLNSGSMFADEPLPAPRPIPTPYHGTGIQYVIPQPVYIYPARKSAYDVWNNYGITSYGRFRARVIVAPGGAYYRYDGSPYPWDRVQPQQWMSGVPR